MLKVLIGAFIVEISSRLFVDNFVYDIFKDSETVLNRIIYSIVSALIFTFTSFIVFPNFNIGAYLLLGVVSFMTDIWLAMDDFNDAISLLIASLRITTIIVICC